MCPGQGNSATGAASSIGKSGAAGAVLSRLTGGLYVPGTGPASPLLLTAAGCDGSGGGLGGGASEGAGCHGAAAGGAGSGDTQGDEEPVGFACFQGTTFELLESSRLTPILLDEEETGDEGVEETKSESGGGGGRPPPPGRSVGGGCPHCAHKLHIKFVDMLTYPRPIRKFEVKR